MFTPFDPLEFKHAKVTDAAFSALRREISNILSSYVGWYDPFCELIQNALDAVDARYEYETAAGTAGTYKPLVRIIVNLDENMLTVTDNGIGLDKDKFEQFLAPNFSFKSGNTRGHKGVGATYVAYGFNYMRVSTRAPGFEAVGRIVGAKNWLQSVNPAQSPKVEPDTEPDPDMQFAKIDRGVSVSVRFDDSTHPRRLDWIKATKADQWARILYVKTGLGAITARENIHVEISVTRNSATETVNRASTQYLWLHASATKTARIRDISDEAQRLFNKHGPGRRLPDKFRNLDFVYETWTTEELSKLVGLKPEEPEERDIIQRYSPTVAVEYGYTAKLWTRFNEDLGVRSNYRVLTPGIQLAANNMPQGETILIPLVRNIGRQNQIHFLFHFENYSPDLGRKGFNRELTDFAKGVARSLTEDVLSRHRGSLKANTGAAPDLARELAISDWKKQMLEHEKQLPLALSSKHFFKPTERVSITSAPTREQDVIALFNQLVAGGVIRGIQVMSTNERFTYDGLYKVSFDLAPEIYAFHETDNPLGVSNEVVEALSGKITDPRVLEYKFTLDGLIEDFEANDKNINDLSLCICWDSGELYKEKYGITSFLIPENSDQRQYHGVTHSLTDLDNGAKQCDLIILSELVQYLNDSKATSDLQRTKYE